MAGNASQIIATDASAATLPAIHSVNPIGLVRIAVTMTDNAAASAITVAPPTTHATTPTPSHWIEAKSRAQANVVNP